MGRIMVCSHHYLVDWVQESEVIYTSHYVSFITWYTFMFALIPDGRFSFFTLIPGQVAFIGTMANGVLK